jgi:hypothetical protein
MLDYADSEKLVEAVKKERKFAKYPSITTDACD